MFSRDLGIFSISVARQSNFEKALASYCAAPSAEKLTYAWHRACYPLATQGTYGFCAFAPEYTRESLHISFLFK